MVTEALEFMFVHIPWYMRRFLLRRVSEGRSRILSGKKIRDATRLVRIESYYYKIHDIPNLPNNILY